MRNPWISGLSLPSRPGMGARSTDPGTLAPALLSPQNMARSSHPLSCGLSPSSQPLPGLRVLPDPRLVFFRNIPFTEHYSLTLFILCTPLNIQFPTTDLLVLLNTVPCILQATGNMAPPGLQASGDEAKSREHLSIPHSPIPVPHTRCSGTPD